MHTKSNFKKLLIWISFLLCSDVYAQSSNQLYAFANNCFAEGNYNLAISAYSRLVFFEKETYGKQCYMNLATAYYATKHYDDAINYYDLAYNANINDSIKTESTLSKALCYMMLKNYDYALIEIYNLSDTLPQKFIQRKNFFEASIYFLKDEFEKSEAMFERIYANDVELTKDLHQLFLAFDKKNKFNVNRAKTLSYILPGLGQAYAGDIKNSVNSFMLTAGFIALYLTVAATVSPIEAIVGIGPWFQRYYQGGAKHAALIAQKRKDDIKSNCYLSVIELIQHSKNISQ